MARRSPRPFHLEYSSHPYRLRAPLQLHRAIVELMRRTMDADTMAMTGADRILSVGTYRNRRRAAPDHTCLLHIDESGGVSIIDLSLCMHACGSTYSRQGCATRLFRHTDSHPIEPGKIPCSCHNFVDRKVRILTACVHESEFVESKSE